MLFFSPIIILTLIVVVGFALILLNKLRSDVAALGIALTLGVAGVLTPQQVFSGFSSSAVMVLIGLFILARALENTGVAQKLGSAVAQLSRGGEVRLIAITMLCGAGLSLFMNNIAAVAVLLPAISRAAHNAKISPSKVMIPLAYSTSLGGAATLLTTANIIVSNMLKNAGYAGYGLLSFGAVGLPFALAGGLFVVLFGRWLLPRKGIARPDAKVLQLGTVNAHSVIYEHKTGIALAIILVTLIVGATELVPIAETMLVGALCLVVTNCISMDEAYAAIEWRTIFIVASMLPISTALLQTGAAQQIGNALVQVFAVHGASAVAVALLLATLLLTQVMGGQAASVVMAAIAISTAQILGVDAQAMAMYVVLGCAFTFISPMAHPVNLYVVCAGGYRDRDFIKIGLPLTLFLLPITVLFMRWQWGL